MKDLLTFSSDNPTIIELLDQGIHFSEYMLNEFEVEKNQKFPTIIQSQVRSVQVMKWGIENPIMSTGPELFYLFGPSLLRQNSLKKLLMNQRMVVPIKKYSKQLLDGRSYVLKSSVNQILYLAGVWYFDSYNNPGFAIITKDFNYDASLNRLPLLIPSKKLDQWLNAKTPILSIYPEYLDHAIQYNIEYKEEGQMKI